MAVTQNYNDYVIGGSDAAEISVADFLLTIASLSTRAQTAFAYKDRGVDALGDGWDFSTTFEIITIQANANVYVFVAANQQNDVFVFNSTGVDHVEARILESGVDRFSILRRVNAGTVVVDNSVGVTPILNNEYRFDTFRIGSTYFADVIDVDGGHGVPGATVTQLSVSFSPGTAYRYQGATSTSDDGTGTSTANYTVGPTVDNAATAGAATNPLKSAILGERGVLAA